DPRAIVDQLLVPLARSLPEYGRLLVAARWRKQVAALLDLAGARRVLVDLDGVPSSQLRSDLRKYVDGRLRRASCPPPVRHALSTGLAEALTAEGRKRGGEFLAAALYVNWLTGPHPGEITPDRARDLAGEVPDGMEALDLDLGRYADDAW